MRPRALALYPEVSLMIRVATPRDAAAIAGIYAPVVERTAISFETEPPTEAEMASRVSRCLEFAPWLVCDEGDAILGYAYASRHNERAAYGWSVNVSVYVGEGARRKGVGKALYGSLFALLRLQGFYAAHAGITLPNEASVGIHESLGFRMVGVYRSVGFKKGAWYDVGWWQLPLRDRTGVPAPPLSLAEATRHPGFAEALTAGAGLVRA